MTPVSIILSDL